MFFVIIIGIVVAFIVAVIVSIARPMFRFMTRASSAKNLYDLVYSVYTSEPKPKEERTEPLIINGVEIKDVTSMSIKDGVYEITLGKDRSRTEVLADLENILKDALSYSDNLGTLLIIDGDLNEYKRNLIDACSNVRMLQWNGK